MAVLRRTPTAEPPVVQIYQKIDLESLVCTGKWWHIRMLHRDGDFLWQIHWSQWATTRRRAKIMSYVPNSDPTDIFYVKSWICAVTTRNYMNEQSFTRTIALCKRMTAKHQGPGAWLCAGFSLLKVKESLMVIQMVQTLHTSENILHVCIHQNVLTMFR